MKIVDMHVHVGQFDLLRDDIQELLKKKPFESDADMPTLFSRPTNLEEYLRANGVERAIILAESGPGTNYSIDSELVAKFAGNNPFFIPFGNINPHHHDAEKEFWHSVELGIRGFKFYPADHSFDPSRADMLRVYEQCEKRHLPIIFHTGLTAQRDANELYIHPRDFAFIAERYPNLTLILAHAGKPHWYAEAIDMLVTYPNVYADTALVSPDDLKYLCEDNHNISNKILFGSDWPVAGSYSNLIHDYLQADIPQSILQNIMHHNAVHLLNTVLAPQQELEHV
ncbi:MAG: amidohydrolase family protein [Legionellaceae bacterium]|nr:amidohydrolase family protein [Legionellaceae bacterium]